MPVFDETAQGKTQSAAEFGVSLLTEVREGCTVLLVLRVSCQLLENGYIDCWQSQGSGFVVGKAETHDLHLYLLWFLSMLVLHLKDLH